MTSLSAKDKFLGEERRVGFKPTGAFSTKKLHISCSFIQNQPTFLHIIAFFLQFNLQFISF